MGMAMRLAREGSRPAPLPTMLERAAGTLHEAILNQELTSMQISAQRLANLARAHRCGSIAGHAAAFAALCRDRPHDTTRMSELEAEIELAMGAMR